MKRNRPTQAIPAALKPFLKPWPNAQRRRRAVTRSDLAELQKYCGPRCRGLNRRERERIEQAFGKPPEKLSFQEFKDYQQPNFGAREYLKELWPQLTTREQGWIIRTNQWAFTFPASFASEHDFLLACAARLRRFFKREFKVIKRERDDQ